MTAEELKEKIQTTRSNTTFGNIAVHASIKFDCEVMMDGNATDVELGQAEEFAKEKIVRHIYPDTRREFYEALQEFISWHYPVPEAGDPWTGPTMSKASAAREKLLKLARYQPHSTDEKKLNPL